MPRHRRGWAMGGGWGERHTPLTISLLEPVLLALIGEQPRHGYTLLADLAQLEITTVHPSVIYRVLRQMEDLGWIESAWETNQTQGPPRKVFSLTAQGRLALSAWGQELKRTQDTIKIVLSKIEQP